MADSKLKKITDVFTLLIAVAALAYSIYEHRQTVELQISQTELSSIVENEKQKPHLQLVFRKINSEPQKGIVVQNVGAGPAKIKSFKYYLNKDGYKNDKSYDSWLKNEQQLIFTSDTLYFEEMNTLHEGYVLSTGRDEEIYLLRDAKKTFYDTQARRDMEDLIIEIEYNSLYSEDKTTYYVRYCEKFKKNNIRKKLDENSFE